MLFDRDRHVAEYRWTAGTGDHEKVREAGRGDSQVGLWSGGPFLFERNSALTADIDLKVGAGHRIEAGSEHDNVKIIVCGCRANAALGNLLDGRLPDIYQGDIVTVVGLEVFGVDEGAFRSKWVVFGDQLLGRGGILDDFPNLRPNEFGRRLVGPAVRHDVVERRLDELKSSLLPRFFKNGVPLFLTGCQGRPVDRRVRGTPNRCFRLVPYLIVVGLDVVEERFVDRPMASRDRVLRGALEHEQMLGLSSDHRDRLHAARTRSDHANALSAQINTVVRPGTCVV